MAKKAFKDYTPEQRWKLQRRLIRVDKSQEMQQLFEKASVSLAGVAKSHREAMEFREASETMGSAEFMQWCNENPLSPHAQLSLMLIEEELAAPDREIAKNRRELQKKFREDRQKIEEEKHEQWRKWQKDEINSNQQFARQSKQEQARRLKKKHSIHEKPASIAKRLEPLPPSKNKK